MSRDTLPTPSTERWQLLRSGLTNVFRFDSEEFWYEQGRLLLRGNNGTGKSRVLALQLPFLLDGDVSPDRLEPDANPARRVEWNLLLDVHEDRLGYTWIEFGRRDESGQQIFLTLGCGLRAVAGRGLVGRWFFVTNQRVNADLFLQTPSGHMLAQDRLTAAVGERGQVFSTAKDYRQAVDAALFGLGHSRYSALVDLLIQLRHPQLSRRFDESKMSAALSGALPPVAEEVIAVVADSFRSLETDRNDLQTFVQAGRAVDDFLSDYRRYASIASRRAAQQLKAASNSYDAHARTVRTAQAAYDEAVHTFAAAASELETLEQQTEASAMRVRTLAASPQMRDAEALQAACELAEEHGRAHERATEHYDHMVSGFDVATVQHTSATQDAGIALSRATEASAAARTSAASVGLESDYTSAVDLLDLPTLQNESAVDLADELLSETSERRRQSVKHLRALNEQLLETRHKLLDAERAMSDATTRAEQSVAGESAAHDDCEQQRRALIASYITWAGRVAELRPTPVEHLEGEVLVWAERPEGRSPIQQAVSAAAATSSQTIANAVAELTHQRQALSQDRVRLEEERATLEAGRYELPPPPYTRSVAARANRPGAPLWRVCDFAADVAPELRAGIEAALEAAGLVDAWLEPSGTLSTTRESDTTIVVTDADPKAQLGQRLSDFLVPSVDAADESAQQIDTSRVLDVLERIGVGTDSGETWITTVGGFRLGPLRGAWSKPEAQYIGHAARAASRRRRLEELAAHIAELDRQNTALDEQLTHFRERDATLQREVAEAPDDGAFRQAYAHLGRCRQEAAERRRDLAEAERVVLSERQSVAAALSKRDAAANDLGLAQWASDLAGYEERHAHYREALARLWPTVRAHATAQRQFAASLKRLDAAKALAETAKRALDESATRARSSAVHYQTLQESKGVAAAEILARYEFARQEESRLRRDREASLQRKIEAAQHEAETRSELARAKHDLDQAAQERKGAVERFRAFATTRLVTLAVPALPLPDVQEWSLSRVIDVARDIDSTLDATDSSDAAWERVQKEIHRPFQELTDALLPHGYQPSAQIEKGVFVVSAVFQGSACTMDELRTALAEEASRRQTLLDAREREVLENHLIGEVAHHLHERLHLGREFVERMNDEVRTRPMSTGMTLRFTWNPVDDGSPGLREARTRLLSDPGTWAAAERVAVGEFLSREIQTARNQFEGGTWDDHLRFALDYRRWHHFGIDRHQDGQWKRLTKRTYGTGSGGEKAVLLTIPLFVAAAAHYQSAARFAPRLILLDEAFVGIDSDMRAKCMGLLSAFELDFIMTSEREWACYATLPGVAICQLSARPGIDAVHVSRWVWNGRQLLVDTRAIPPARPQVLTGPNSNAQLVSSEP